MNIFKTFRIPMKSALIVCLPLSPPNPVTSPPTADNDDDFQFVIYPSGLFPCIDLETDVWVNTQAYERHTVLPCVCVCFPVSIILTASHLANLFFRCYNISWRSFHISTYRRFFTLFSTSTYHL